MRRGCWRGNVILVFKYMKDYYCFTDADSSEPSSLDHFPGLLIHSCQSSGPSRRWIGLTCSPHCSHATTVSTRLHSLSPDTQGSPTLAPSSPTPHSTFSLAPPRPAGDPHSPTSAAWPGFDFPSYQLLTALMF